MLIFNIISDPILFVGFLIAILSAITIHESAHAWVAYKLGDPTAKLEGRISANPFVHLDTYGTIMLLLAGFGWGKPVPVNIHNLKSKWDEVKIAYAGAFSNFLLALFCSIVLRFIPLPIIASQILYLIIQINLTLMVFNILPVPPLDGATIYKIIFPENIYQTIYNLSSPIFLTFIFFLYASPLLRNFIANSVGYLAQLLIGY